MLFSEIEVDNAYTGVGAVWLSDLTGGKVNLVSRKLQNETTNAHASSESVETSWTQGQVTVKDVFKIPPLPTSSFIETKLQKKLKKNQFKKDVKEKEERSETIPLTVINNKKHCVLDKRDGDESKTEAMSKLTVSHKHSPAVSVLKPAHTKQSLTEKLNDPALSHASRKRFRKRLNKILQAELQCDTQTENTHNDDSHRVAIKRPRYDQIEDGQHVTHKKKKRRSRLKNIRKDNRPEDMKPAHLRKSVMEPVPDKDR